MSDIISIVLNSIYDNRPEEFKVWFRGRFDDRDTSNILHGGEIKHE
jgi:hypothetical protein